MSAPSLTWMGALRSYLLSVTAIDTLVTTSGVSRITPIPLDPTTLYPAITLQEIAAKALETMEGPSGCESTRFQINCWSKSYMEAWTLRKLVKAALSCYKGPAGSFTIKGSNHAGDREFQDAKLEAHQLICDFYIWWEE